MLTYSCAGGSGWCHRGGMRVWMSVLCISREAHPPSPSLAIRITHIIRHHFLSRPLLFIFRVTLLYVPLHRILHKPHRMRSTPVLRTALAAALPLLAYAADGKSTRYAARIIVLVVGTNRTDTITLQILGLLQAVVLVARQGPREPARLRLQRKLPAHQRPQRQVRLRWWLGLFLRRPDPLGRERRLCLRFRGYGPRRPVRGFVVLCLLRVSIPA
jgi:hypothetical protein